MGETGLVLYSQCWRVYVTAEFHRWKKSCHNTAHPQSRRGSEAHTSLGMGHGMWKGRTRGWWWWWRCLQQSCLLAGRRLKWSSLAMRTAAKQTRRTSLLQWREGQLRKKSGEFRLKWITFLMPLTTKTSSQPNPFLFWGSGFCLQLHVYQWKACDLHYC